MLKTLIRKMTENRITRILTLMGKITLTHVFNNKKVVKFVSIFMIKINTPSILVDLTKIKGKLILKMNEKTGK